MTTDVFERWFDEDYCRLVDELMENAGLPKMSFLFVDNYPGHGKSLHSYDGRHVVLYLPPRTTSLIQPLDQEIIANICKIYDKNTNQDVHQKRIEEGKLQQECVALIKAGYAVNQLEHAWSEISEEAIKHGWKPLLGDWLDDRGLTLEDEFESEPIDSTKWVSSMSIE